MTWTALFLAVACGGQQPSKTPEPELAPTSASQVAPKLTDADIEILKGYLADGGWSTVKEAEKRAVAGLEAIAPGWVDTYNESYEARMDGCDPLRRFSREQRMKAGGSAPTAEEREVYEAEEARCQELEEELPQHLRSLGQANADRADVHILIAVLENWRDPEHDLSALVAQFPQEAQVWAWQATLGLTARRRLEAAHRCLSLDPAYTTCKGAYEAAVVDYQLPGCEQADARGVLHMFGVSKEQDADFLVPVQIGGEPYYQEPSPSLSAEDFAGVWRRRSANRYDFVSVELTAMGQEKLLAMTTRLTDRYVVWQIGDRLLEVALVTEPIASDSLELFGWPRGDLADKKLGLFELCSKVEQRPIPKDLVWQEALVSQEDN